MILGAFDETRITGLIELGLANHPDPERLWRLLARGALFFVRDLADDQLEVYAGWCDDPEQRPGGITAAEAREMVSVIKFPRSALLQGPQG